MGESVFTFATLERMGREGRPVSRWLCMQITASQLRVTSMTLVGTHGISATVAAFSTPDVTSRMVNFVDIYYLCNDNRIGFPDAAVYVFDEWRKEGKSCA